MALKAIDFFAGIGGVTHGFLNAGIDVIAGIDIDETCKKTYETNNIRTNGCSSKFLCEDITKIDIKKIQQQITSKDSLVLIGCAPCQPFTKITKKLDGRINERGLLRSFAEVISKLKPEYLFLENVQGLNSPKNKEILIEFLDSLKPHYNLVPKIVNALNYGVPQSRRRIIMFGKRDSFIEFPKPTHGFDGGKKEPLTLYKAIGSLPEIKAGEKHSKMKTHSCAKLNPINLKRLTFQKAPGDVMDKWPEELQLKSRKIKEYKGHKDVYARLWWDKPSVTLTTKFVSVSNGRFAHPKQNRGLSILEGLLIQSFPKNYKLLSPFLRTQSKQIGNAVPVKLAEAFAKKILADFTESKSALIKPYLP